MGVLLVVELILNLLAHQLHLLGMLRQLRLNGLRSQSTLLGVNSFELSIPFIRFFNWLELHECIDVVLELTNHMLLEQEIISSSQVIVFVVLDRLQ